MDRESALIQNIKEIFNLCVQLDNDPAHPLNDCRSPDHKAAVEARRKLELLAPRMTDELSEIRRFKARKKQKDAQQ